jgi:hypothetical protein
MRTARLRFPYAFVGFTARDFPYTYYCAAAIRTPLNIRGNPENFDYDFSGRYHICFTRVTRRRGQMREWNPPDA